MSPHARAVGILTASAGLWLVIAWWLPLPAYVYAVAFGGLLALGFVAGTFHGWLTARGHDNGPGLPAGPVENDPHREDRFNG